ncbi:MAG: RNA 2'-phosphotransferase [Candidatus Latescibacteria bacterium]|jgi:putative RNA 2'-phosphotransferase|nr:RNA 2'-phosphotransferase [Candidatus Latescibacterota bacterium]MBT4136505.1 RNA 2'-phosphotransferase [Candidatus Latescibacterota bacterium]MBT5829911.1 RNA 2'-phosphotransferase [Candidatus Latescibacterota bacterium]
MMRNKVQMSKLLSLMLRHRPDEFGLEMDQYGYVDLQAVLEALQKKDASLTIEAVEAVVYDGEKQRFEIVEGRIRARYGHSFDIELGVDSSEPQEFLYKGVDPSASEAVISGGLQPQDRQYLHLSFDADVAEQLSSRPGRLGAVIRIDAKRAFEAGVPFYDCGPTILTQDIPAEFVGLEREGTVEVKSEAKPEVSASSSAQEDAPKKITYGRRPRSGTRR